MSEIKTFKGAGGGRAPKVTVPTLTPDTLRSKDKVEIILGLCEGPIKGPRYGDRSFWVGDTPLQNIDGSYNFISFYKETAIGVDDPEPIDMKLGGQFNSTSVGVSLAKNTPVTRQTGNNIDFIDVRLSIDTLNYSDTEGTFETDVWVRIEYRKQSDTTWQKFWGQDLKIFGKTGSRYTKDFRSRVENVDEPYLIRVTALSDRETFDKDKAWYRHLSWDSFQEGIQEDPVFPYLATTHLLAESTDQFSSIPQFGEDIDGLIIRIPSNYDPELRTYDGIWDGTFELAYSNNPAWVLYDVVMNERYGLIVDYPDINLDKYDVYEAAQWCDEIVNGEPRFMFDAIIDSARSSKELARYIAGTFNATFSENLSGNISLVVDKMDAASHIFTQENIYGDFEYSYTDMANRYNDITVSFRNPEMNWEVDRRRVFKQELIDKFGRIEYDFVDVGAIRESQAIRDAWYKLITANTETEMVTFKTNRLGQFVSIFETILICDKDMGSGLSGRIKSINPDSPNIVNLRDPVFIEPGIEYIYKMKLNSGDMLLTKLSSSQPTGVTYELHLDTILPIEDTPYKAVFTLENDEELGYARPYRVLSIEEDDGNVDMVIITAININRLKYEQAANGDILL